MNNKNCKRCKTCDYAKRGFFASVPEAYVCIGVKEPFVISDYPNAKCSAYPLSLVDTTPSTIPDYYACPFDKYESPIKVFQQIRTEYDNEIFKAVQSVYTDVNKDELIKALTYDRQQYEKGYADGAREMRDKMIKIFREYMNDKIDDILKEMVE